MAYFFRNFKQSAQSLSAFIEEVILTCNLHLKTNVRRIAAMQGHGLYHRAGICGIPSGRINGVK